jgi:hypothetical protein
MKCLYTENYKNLATAIVLQAVRDYRHTYRNKECMRNVVAKFFHSQWFTTLTTVDGGKIIKKLKEERKNGNGQSHSISKSERRSR